ncbi:hypothetical protein FB382_002543 [Nocardioides ginsengisegetis]|uniref:Uncharacterized protein n=1 Tax=Nocardioides ginsengisegetis TaxID=661491 RepID=A0A7W3PAA4_9ACTN|nr:hypothetical protein [Nocardioides ginsengisegetis]MBA8804252.1 hypothetical protein [Nocardioides ginsengisegetis]
MPRISILVVLVLLAGCGSRTGASPDEGGDVPITQAAIAAVALDHLDVDVDHLQATYTDRSSPQGLLGADIRYGSEPSEDGDLVRVTLQPHLDRDPCAEAFHCVDLGDGVHLRWGEVVPEEDPGSVAVILQGPREDVMVLSSGPDITGDPRDLDLQVPVEDLEAIARDDRLHLSTTQDVVDAGDDLEAWGGQEPDPHAYDREASTDSSLVNAYLLRRGGYAGFTDQGSSPLKASWGPGAVGGRIHRLRELDVPAADIDVLASISGPTWVAAEACHTQAYDHCARFPGARWPRYLLWQPGPDGQVWMLQRREGEYVGVRFSGFDVPEAQDAVEVVAEWYLVKGFLGDRNLGLRCDKEVVEFDLAQAQAEGR